MKFWSFLLKDFDFSSWENFWVYYGKYVALSFFVAEFFASSYLSFDYNGPNTSSLNYYTDQIEKTFLFEAGSISNIQDSFYCGLCTAC